MPVDPENIRIVVVDDDKFILNTFSDMLEQTGFHADFYPTAVEALKKILNRPKRYDLLIVDIFMPEIDGIEFAKRIRTLLPDLPIMFMTGNVTAEKKAEALALGRVEFLEKPFPLIDELQEMITRFVANE
ncbi:MAG: hypothetical protein AUJ71_00025 [Candidatus Omnitrophica bacterium CG1_02_49_16]|nr:MAG: hypothetical protein AUJ71_00025 [Candidatus Omnitrophica bacterium CG1_02_49_16]